MVIGDVIGIGEFYLSVAIAYINIKVEVYFPYCVAAYYSACKGVSFLIGQVAYFALGEGIALILNAVGTVLSVLR